MDQQPRQPSPRRVVAGRRNRAKRGPLTAAGRERLREAALRNRPWRHSTGPRTPEGKQKVALNGRHQQKGELSVRQRRQAVQSALVLVNRMAACRRLVESPL
jgi:hypothetical protein